MLNHGKFWILFIEYFCAILGVALLASLFILWPLYVAAAIKLWIPIICTIIGAMLIGLSCAIDESKRF